MKKVFLAVLGLALVAGNPAAAKADVYGFELQGPGSAINPTTGGYIKVTGTGAIDTDDGEVSARGSYSIYTAAGALVERGTWSADELDYFEAGEVFSNGFQAGYVEMTITVRPQGGAAVSGIPMTVLCVAETPGAEVPEPGKEGVTVGPFSQRNLGFVLFKHMGG